MTDPLTPPRKHVSQAGVRLRFGPFQLFPAERQLLESGKPVRLGSRALEILNLLVEKAGQVVSKEELIARVWPTTVVEEVNLRVHVAAVRRALGDGQLGNRYIVNAAGRGYSFVGTVIRDPESAVIESLPANQVILHNLPNALSRMVGRSTDVESLMHLVRSQRLVTIAGPAGVGKSTVALCVARQLVHDFKDGVCFVDLGAVSKGTLILNAFATALGVAVSTNVPLIDLVAHLRNKTLLLVLDNCEHLVETVASTVEELLRKCPEVRVVATTREPLNAEGEWTYRVSPLPVPPENDDGGSAVAIQRYAAVELFVERAITSDHGFELIDSNAPVVAHICRSLDGLPLAIELAAARTGLYGIQELAARLDDHVARVASHKRTAASRHQTLWATLAWSYDLLNDQERIALCRLAAFNGAFTIESAVGLVAHGELGVEEASMAVIGLADKSLLTTDMSGSSVRHRLLNTTRSYAFEKLAKTDDIGVILRWHAEQLLRLMRQAELGWETMRRSEWVASYGYAIDDVRAALEWSFSTDGNPELGTALTVVSVPFGFQLSLVEEFYARAQFALDWITARGPPQPALEIRLRGAISILSQNMQRSRQVDEALEPGLDRVSPKLQINPLLQKTIYQIEIADYGAALRSAEQLSVVARQIADPLAVLMADRVSAQAQHFYGNHSTARIYAERVLDHPARAIPLAYIPLQVDRQVSMRIILARILWLEGLSDQALALAKQLCDLAAADSPFALCQALALAACPIAFWCFEDGQARVWASDLMREASRYKLDFWRSYGERFQDALSQRASATQNQVADFAAAERASPRAASGLLFETLLTIAPGTVTIDSKADEGPRAPGWGGPEKLRVLGELALRETPNDETGRSEMLFLRSVEMAERQNALAWNLRASISLAELWSQKGRRRDALGLLQSVYGRFSEGFNTHDMQAAAALLQRLA
jgi:predicted ATPase/DNA-binding winged helix-turn-helix (wHTH) protein